MHESESDKINPQPQNKDEEGKAAIHFSMWAERQKGPNVVLVFVSFPSDSTSHLHYGVWSMQYAVWSMEFRA